MKKTKNDDSKDKAKDYDKHIKEKSKNDEKVVIVGVILLFVIFATIILVINTQKEPVIPENPNISIYKDYVFIKKPFGWETEMEISDKFKGWTRTYTFLFHYTPGEVEHIPTMKNVRNDTVTPNLFINARKIYITTDPEYPAAVVLAGVEISKILGNVYEKKIQAAITRPDNRTDAPVKTCRNMTLTERVIHLNIGEPTSIYSNKGCIVVQGVNETELLKAATRLTYELLKVL